MRRTYRSKKESGGVMDPREVGATFDAFYIQNIKQSKREMSVGFGASTYASNKVRKRKYVKRLKEQSPMSNAPKTEDSISKSENLTPDKSIHLKRALDPFDLLLNNDLSTNNKECLQATNNGLSPLPTKGKRKPAYKKKARKAYTKKINYSSETDSGDEHFCETGRIDITQDQSDILSHKLEIEKCEKVSSNNIDQSINEIDLSLIKNITSPLSSTMEDKLTMSVKSPLCSTPFHKIYRGKSIYKFSPICVEFDKNKDFNTISERFDGSINAENINNEINDQHSTVADKLKEIKLNNKNDKNNFKDQKCLNYNEVNSPILQTRDNTYKNKSRGLAMSKHQLSKYKEISSLQTSEEELFLGFPKRRSDAENINLKNVINKFVEIKEKLFEDVQTGLELSKTSKSFVENNNNKYCCQEDMNNVSKPDNTTSENTSVIEKSFEKLQCQHNVLALSKVDLEKQKSGQYSEDTKVNNNDKDLNIISKHQYDAKEPNITNEVIIERSQISYLEENGIDINEYTLNDENSSKVRQESCVLKIVLSSNEEDSSETSQIHSNENSLSENIGNVSGSSLIYSENNTIENEKNSSQTYSKDNRVNERSSDDRDNIFKNSLDSESLYESCNSENEMSVIEINNKKPIVVVDRLNSSVLNRYYKKGTDPDSIFTSESDENNDESYSSDISNNRNTSIKDNMPFLKGTISSTDENYDNLLENTMIHNISNTDQDNETFSGPIVSSKIAERNDQSYFCDFSSNRNTNIENKNSFSDSFKSSDEDFENDLQEDTMMNINIDQENDENNTSYEDIFVSFVTTRRRNEITKDSFKLSFENPRTSTTSIDLNETVLSNTKRSIDSLKESNDPTLIVDTNLNMIHNISYTDQDIDTSSDPIVLSEIAERNDQSYCSGFGSNSNTSIENKNSFSDSFKSSDEDYENDLQEGLEGSVCDDVLNEKENSITVTNTQLESELGQLSPKIKRISTAVRKSVTKRKSAKLSVTENCDKISINKNNEKREAVTSRKSTKKSSSNMNRESISEENDVTSRNGVVTRRSTKYNTDINSVTISEEDVNNTLRSSVVPRSNKIDRGSSRMQKERIDKESMLTARKVSYQECDAMMCSKADNMSTSEIKPGIVLEPGKRWERSLSIYRRITAMSDLNQSILDEALSTKGRKYRQSVINTMEMQDISVSVHNESVRSRRSTLYTKPSRSTIKIVRESNTSRYSLSSTSSISEDLEFLTEDCDDTLVELSKLSISEHEVTVLDKFNDTSSRITTARDYVLRRCNQTDVILFDECYPDTALKNCRKIGEGVYGEVFLWRAGDGRARVLKIVPIAGDAKVNGESQKDYHEIISEIVIAMELSALRAPITDIEKHLNEGKGVETLDLHSVENATDVFNEVLAVRCVYGSYPSRLLDLWELYDECKGSDNDNPAILPVDQQFMVLELANAGEDLESYQFHNAEQAYALFQQVAFGLAVAEEAFQFEHRDLHWGNVLIAPTDQKYATFVLRGRTHRVPRRGVAATIIDYSLSRLSLRLPTADTAALYNDLAADDGLFDAVGDYQFEVYRLMRDKLGNDWKNFEPYTNILWLHYTVDKMITALRYTRTNTKIHKHYIAKLKEIKNRILEYGSAVQYVLTDNEL